MINHYGQDSTHKKKSTVVILQDGPKKIALSCLMVVVDFYGLWSINKPAGLEMGRVKTAFSCHWQEVNHAFRSVFSCFYVVLEGQFYCDFQFSLGITVYS